MIIDVVVGVLFAAGVFFFLAGSVGLLRFPDLHSRLHALTKADNLGLGFIALGAAIQAGDVLIALKLLLIWLIVLVGSGLVCFLIAQGVGDGRAARSADASK